VGKDVFGSQQIVIDRLFQDTRSIFPIVLLYLKALQTGWAISAV
jgi:hypothetical protein